MHQVMEAMHGMGAAAPYEALFTSGWLRLRPPPHSPLSASAPAQQPFGGPAMSSAPAASPNGDGNGRGGVGGQEELCASSLSDLECFASGGGGAEGPAGGSP